MELNTYKPKVMMHYVKPGSTGGPNILFKRIEDNELLADRYKFVPLNQNRVAGGKINIPLILDMKKEIQKEKPDIIHISGMQSTGFHCMVAAKLAGCSNRIVTTHGFSGEALGISFIKRFSFNWIIEPITLMLAKKVHAISTYTEKKFMVRKFAKGKTRCIYNFPPPNKTKVENYYVRESLGISKDDIVFTVVSRIVVDKGYKQLASAINNLTEYQNIKFFIVGDGEYEEDFKAELKNEIKNNKVHMLGKREDIMNILHESDVFVLPTLHENLGNVFLEASMASLPSIGTNVGGVPEIIIDQETGLLIPAYNPNALKEAILTMYNNESLRKDMGEQAYRRVNEFFNSENIAYQFDDLYKSIL